VESQEVSTAVLNNQLQSKIEIAAAHRRDFERGTAMRLDEGTRFQRDGLAPAASKDA